MAKRTKEEALQTRESIIDAAIAVFHEHGVARPSLSEVAKLAGVTRGAVYGHFENKADLFSAICDRIRLPTEAVADPECKACQQDPLGSLRAAWVDLFKAAARNPQKRQILDIIFHRCELVEESGAIQQRMHEGYTESISRMLRVLERAVEIGQLPADLDIDRAVHLLHGGLIGVLQVWLFRPDAYDLEAQAECYVDSLFEMLRTAPTLQSCSPA